MKLTRLTHLLMALALCALCACTNNKSYTINGTIDLPETLTIEDSTYTIPSLEGMLVYLFDIDNSVVDSAMIEDNHFSFEGELGEDEDAFFVQFVSPVGGALMAVEPGTIDVKITTDKTYITGTPANECISETDDALSNLRDEFTEKLAQLTDTMGEDQELDMEQQMSLYSELMERTSSVLDSLYELHKDNIGAGYIVMLKHSDVETVAELEDALSEYPEAIQQNPLIVTNLNLMRQYELMMSEEGDDPTEFDLDTIAAEAE